MHFRAQRRKWLVGERLARFAPDDGGADAPIDDEGRAQRGPKDCASRISATISALAHRS